MANNKEKGTGIGALIGAVVTGVTAAVACAAMNKNKDKKQFGLAVLKLMVICITDYHES